MPLSIPGLDVFPANIVSATANDPAAGTEHGPTEATQLANRTRWLANRLRNIIADFDVAQVADGSSTYTTIDSTVLTGWDNLTMQVVLTADVGDLLVAVAQVTGKYTGANWGEMRLADKSNAVVSAHARWSSSGVLEGRVLTLYEEVANAGGRSVDLEGRVSTSGSLSLDGSAILWGVVLRKAPVAP